MLDAPLADRRELRSDQAPVGLGAARAEEPVSPVRPRCFLAGHVSTTALKFATEETGANNEL